MVRIYSIVSGKGGVGKTTVTSNIGVILAAELRKKVLLLDGNISTANLAIHLGFIKCPVSIQDLIDNNLKTYQAIYVHKSGLHIIPASLSLQHEQHDYGAKVLAKRLEKILSDVAHQYDVILVDGAAGISGEARAAIAASHSTVVVTVPEIPTVTAAIKVVEVARLLGVPVFGLVLNRVRGGRIELSRDEIEASCREKVICSIPEDEAVRESTSHREPVCVVRPGSPSARELRKLARMLAGSESRPAAEKRPPFLLRILGFGRKGRKPEGGKPEGKPEGKADAKPAKAKKGAPEEEETHGKA